METSVVDLEALKARQRQLLYRWEELRQERKAEPDFHAHGSINREINRTKDAIREVEKQIKAQLDARAQTQFYENAMGGEV